MAFSDFIKNLQDKPDHIKNRILWSTSIVAGVLVVGVWFANLKHQIQNISGTDIINLNTGNTSNESQPHYLAIENAEQKDGRLLVYFHIQNDTQDILNFSTASDISLALGGGKITPSIVTNRQNQAFPKKVLSNSQTFGILIFDNPQGQEGQLTFDNLYFEQSPETIFKEALEFDLSKLTPPPSIRE